MSIVMTGYTAFQRAKGLWSNKVISVFSLFITIFVALNSFNTYAASLEEYANTKYDPTKSFQDVDTLEGTAVGDTGPNAQKGSGGIPYLAGMHSIIFALAPQILTTYDDIQVSNVSPMAKAGVLGIVDQGIVAMYNNPPAVDMGRHIAKEWVPGANSEGYASYAAEDGYSFLTSIGIDSLWEKSRLLAYVFFVVVLIAAGFMIMFRQKIGGQLAITVFNTLPNVVFGLILVTFSFAIVGLMLNIGVLLINVIGSFLDPSGADLISVNNPFSLVGILVRPGAATAGVTTLVASLGPVLIGIIATMLGAGAAGIVAGAIAGAIVILVVLGLLIYASVKVYITLLVAYLGIILDTVLGPLYLVLSTVPGQDAIRNNWWKRVLRNALVFPAVFFFINLGLFILKNDFALGFPSGLTGGSFANADTDGSLVGALLKAAITLVCFFLAAEAPKFLSDFIKTDTGRGAQDAMGGLQKSFGKIPIIGGFFG